MAEICVLFCITGNGAKESIHNFHILLAIHKIFLAQLFISHEQN